MTAQTERKGDWMQTFTGRAFWPLDPRADDVCGSDIAHSLGMQCRYNGHVQRFYSVAEHCVLMSYAVSPENALAALLHDATEAYVTDVPRPLKPYLAEYADIERGVWQAIAARYGISPRLPEEVKQADASILLDEKDALLGPAPRAWGVEGLTPLGVEVRCWTPGEASVAYISRLLELTETWPC